VTVGLLTIHKTFTGSLALQQSFSYGATLGIFGLEVQAR